MITGLTPIGNCFSGLLGAPSPVLRRIALATPRALHTVLKNRLLQENLLEVEKRPRDTRNHLNSNNLQAEIFFDWRNNPSFGLHLTRPPSEQQAYAQAKALMISMKRGAHRRIFFARMGVKTGPEVAEISPHLYAALLARIRDRVGAAELRQIASVQVWEKAFDKVEESSEGLVLKFSRNLLEREPRWSHPEEY